MPLKPWNRTMSTPFFGGGAGGWLLSVLLTLELHLVFTFGDIWRYQICGHKFWKIALYLLSLRDRTQLSFLM